MQIDILPNNIHIKRMGSCVFDTATRFLLERLMFAIIDQILVCVYNSKH